MDKVAAIPYTWTVPMPDKTKLFQWIDIWNDQIGQKQEGKFSPTCTPCLYIEIQLGNAMNMGQNISLYNEVKIILHIVDWQLDGYAYQGGTSGTNERIAGLGTNLEIFTWRDLTKTYMDNFRAGNFGAMTEVEEKQDFHHDGIYHYTMEFKTSFTDLKATYFDPNQVAWAIKEPPTALRMSLDYVDSNAPQQSTVYFWKVYVIYIEVVTTPNPLRTQTLGNGAVLPIEYALNLDGTLTIPYLISFAGITPVAPFIIDNTLITTQTYDETTGTFDNSAGGGFVTDVNKIYFNASLPLGIYN